MNNVKNFPNGNLRKIYKLKKLVRNLAQETKHTRLLELIIDSARDITNADGGTLYLPDRDNTLRFAILINRSLNMHWGGSSSSQIPFDNLDLYDVLGNPNHHNIACSCYLSGKTIGLKDAYQTHRYDFSGARIFDRHTGYRTKSVLAIPLKDQKNNIIGVIQLVNAIDSNNKITSFSGEDIVFCEFLASHAAINLSNLVLTEKLSNLFESFAKTLATAIDDKSPYTGKHCHRVPEIAMMLTEEAQKCQNGVFKDFSLTDEEVNEMKLAALLHDCGKVTTPVHIMDKATKLETIYDRINIVEKRFELALKDAEIDFLKEKIKYIENKSYSLEVNEQLCQTLAKKRETLENDLEFLKKANIGQEFMPKSDQERVLTIHNVHKYKQQNGEYSSLLTPNEFDNLMIQRGTLTDEERNIINHHIVMTIKMLSQMDFPEHLKDIPAIAGSHHERLDGTGFPRKLKGDELSVRARIICIADIFEALTAKDRPYKKGKTLSETLVIMGRMVESNHLDRDLFELFIDTKLYLKYGKLYLEEFQIDEVDLKKIPGYRAQEERGITKQAA